MPALSWNRHRAAATAACLMLTMATSVVAAPTLGWPQWGGNPQHTSAAPVAAQPLRAILADVVYDPFAFQEIEEGGGALLVHFQAPLVDGADVYMESKSGQYVSCDPPGSGEPVPCGPGAWDRQIWNVVKFSWQNGTLLPQWTFVSDWNPEPDAGALQGFEPVFHPVLAGDFLYVPGLGGTVHKVSKSSGREVATINPFPEVDPSRYVAGGLAADAAGHVLYDAIQLDLSDPWGADVRGSWLVRVDLDDAAATADLASLVAGAPGPTDLCTGTFPNSQRPWPPSPTAVPPSSPCGSQRVALNAVPAIAPDGTIYTVSRAHFNQQYGYLVAVHTDLSLAWSASLRGILNDGCGVLVPYGPNGCRDGATQGVDPATNDRPAGLVLDRHTSSPVVLPDGAILYAAKTVYNEGSGHLFKFGPDGSALATYDAGFDLTPAVFAHDGDYSIVLKQNAFGQGATDYYLVSVDENLEEEWEFDQYEHEELPEGTRTAPSPASTTIQTASNGASTSPPSTRAGITYANSDDGFVYAIDRSGELHDSIFLNVALGAAYTPVSIGPDGRIYAQNSGHLIAVGVPTAPRQSPEHTDRSPGAPRTVERP